MLILLNTLVAGYPLDHVFFRSKSDIHTKRSRWLVGLVLDFELYENYLLYVNRIVEQVNEINHIARTYFQKIKTDASYKTTIFHAAGVQQNSRENLKINYYYQIFQAQQNEFKTLQELHDRNWVDFAEIIQVGHSELEQSRKANRKQVRRKRFLGLAAGIFSGIAYFETKKIKHEVDILKSNQQVIRHVLTESLSLINITRMEVEENRHAINEIIRGMGKLVEAWQRSVRDIVNRIAPLERFALAYAQSQINLNKLRDLIIAETNLFTNLHAKIAKLSTKRLSPLILPAPELVKILKSIEVELPPQLMLPRDPRETPWYYYNILTTSTIALQNQLVITVEIPLLDVTQRFSIKEAISLPVPYSNTNVTGEYEFEFKNFAVSADKRQYVILTLEDQMNCGKADVNFCKMTSAVYEMNHHQYCTLALFQKDLRKIQHLCKTRVTNKLKLPIAKYISKGQWLVATNEAFYLRKLCVNSDLEEQIIVKPPFILVTLASGCRALADKLELPIYFEQRSEYKVERESRVTDVLNTNLTNLPIWEPLKQYHFDVETDLKTLPPIDSKPINELVQMLEETKSRDKFKLPTSSIPYIIIASVIFVIVLLLFICYLKRQLIMGHVTKRVLKNVSLTKKPHYVQPTPRRSSTSDSGDYLELPALPNNNALDNTKDSVARSASIQTSVTPGTSQTRASSSDVVISFTDMGKPKPFGLGRSEASPRPGKRPQTTLRMSRRARR